MRNYFIMLCCIFLFVLSCNSNRTNSISHVEDIQFEIEMSELEFLNRDDLDSTLFHLDSAYNFILENDREINFLYVTQSSDSILFDFSTFPNDYVLLLFNQFDNNRVRGYWEYKSNRYLLVLDDIGLFESKKNRTKLFNFGYQQKEYSVIFEPLLYRYYLNSDGRFIFVFESWFVNYY